MTGVDGEKAALHEFLRHQRGVIRQVLAGLGDEELRRPAASEWSPLGMVEHLGQAERHWFQAVFTGRLTPLPWPDDDLSPLTTPRTGEVVWAFYDDQCRISDEIIDASALTDPPIGRHPVDWLAAQTTDLRRIILHMIEETARHAGHLDAARELLDGRTGLGPR
jgi:hypothetical protein